MTPIRVLIADDQAMFREALHLLLSAPDDIAVVGEAADGQQAIERCATLHPDVVVMDVRMPTVDGIEATRQIMAASGGDADDRRPRVLVLTTFDVDEHVYAALHAGAAGFILKDASAAALADAVRVVAAGDAMLAPSVTRRLIAQFARMGAPHAPLRSIAGLTVRETEVLALIAQGQSNVEIADQLSLSPETIKTHVGRILYKLGRRDRTQAAIFAWEHGVVQR